MKIILTQSENENLDPNEEGQIGLVTDALYSGQTIGAS